MSEHQKISAIAASDEIHSVYLINAASLQKSKNGPYWRLEFKDASGTLEAKIWSPLSLSFPVLTPGQMAEVTGRVSLFRDQPQLTVDAMRVLSEEESAALPLEEYLPSSERPSADMLADIEALCEAVFTHKPWKKFVRSVLNDKRIRSRLLVAPAAKSMHHAYAGGLLEHLLSVAGLCMHMADHYSDLDRQALLAGALLHDIGKIDEMGGVLTTEYTDEGRLLGHIAQGLIMLEPFLQKSGLEPELAAHFKHLVASHHGEREFGAISVPATPEAFALHFADNMDAKLNQCSTVPQAENEGGMAWGPWQSLLGRALCRPVRTPSPAALAVGESQRKGRAEKKNDRMDERQCSLL
ncbi:MAG: HD domain-containing protein [Mailhella sp.]|nr:HD domain-containing protein [Mailhella sp.]